MRICTVLTYIHSLPISPSFCYVTNHFPDTPIFWPHLLYPNVFVRNNLQNYTIPVTNAILPTISSMYVRV